MPVRELVPVFAVTFIETLPLPVPDELVDSQVPPLVTFAVQLHPLGVVTVEMLE